MPSRTFRIEITGDVKNIVTLQRYWAWSPLRRWIWRKTGR